MGELSFIKFYQCAAFNIISLGCNKILAKNTIVKTIV